MRYYFIVILLASAFFKVAAKTIEPTFNAHDLSITWEALQNDAPNRGQSLNAITITNDGKNTFPATGWKMYFNSARLVASATVTGNATISFVNGDLFSLTPTNTFTEIKPGESVVIKFIDEEPVVTLTDGPEGFYVVWDEQPDKGYNTGAFTIKPFKPNYVGLVTPAIIYDQNKNIKDIPEEQLTKVFPTPVSYKETGGVFSLDERIVMGYSIDNKFEQEGKNLRTFLNSFFDGKYKPSPKSINLNVIQIIPDGNLKEEEYELSVAPHGITINASTPIGAFYAIQSLKTLIPPSAYAHTQKGNPNPLR